MLTEYVVNMDRDRSTGVCVASTSKSAACCCADTSIDEKPLERTQLVATLMVVA